MAKKRKKNKIKNILKYEIIGLILLSLSLYSTYAIIAENPGKVGIILKFILGFLFGQGSILFSIFLIWTSGYLIIKSKLFQWNRKITAFIIMAVNYCILQYLFVVQAILTSSIGSEILYISWENAGLNSGGGVIGLLFSSILVSLFSQTGALIYVIFSSIIAIIMITQKSLKNFMIATINYVRKWCSQFKNQISDFVMKPELKEGKNSNKKEKSSSILKSKIDQLDEKIKILDYTQEEELHVENNKEELHTTTSKESTEEKVLNISYVSNSNIADYDFPPIDLLNKPTIEKSMAASKKRVLNNAKVLEKTLNDFGVQAKVVQVNMGPTITRYELQPSPGVKVSKIVNLSDDISLSLASSGVRIEAPIPGKAAIGIEVPNPDTSTVFIRDLLESEQFKTFPSDLAFAVGKDIAGKVLVTNIAKMPHMLIAGATGSGKSVCINTLITSIIYKSSPQEVRLILVDPKVVELNIYNGIPHLLIPVVTDPKKAAGALNWAVQEMTERYKKFADSNVRDLTGYNELFAEEPDKKMPQIVVIIDELADLMMVSPHDVEDAICRLAQMARAAGIHLIVATQRPSVDVITGVIKANIPSRIAFAVSSQMDSRTILDMGGAEKLLGKGDMLFYPVGEAKPLRVQGAFISDKEVEKVVQHLKNQNDVSYNEAIMEEITSQPTNQDIDQQDDELLSQAIDLAIENQQISISMLQRRLKIGYARAARLVDEMEERNIIGGYEGSKPRKVLISKEEAQES